MAALTLLLLSLILGFSTLSGVESGAINCGCSGDCSMRLDLSDLGIHHIRRPFIESTNVKELLLSYNGIQDISKGCLEGMKNLQHLDLSYNNIPSGKLFHFGSLPNLTGLNLEGNRDLSESDESVVIEVTSYLPKLTKLSLRNTSCEGISEEWEQNLPNLSHVDFSRNPINASKLFPNIPSSVSHLYVRAARLHSLDLNLVKNLTLLALDGNHFEVIGSKSSKKTLNLSTSVNLTIKELSLSRCRIKKVDESAFESLGDLLHLNISQNSIGKVPSKCLKSLPSLHTLDLSGNSLEELPQLNLLSNLTTLSLNHLEHIQIFESLTADVLDLPRLQKLSLQGNELQALKRDCFSRLPALMELDLSKNKLANLKLDWHPDLHLKKLNLQANSFQSVEDMHLNATQGLDVVDISNNHITAVTLESLKYLPPGVSIPLGSTSTCAKCCD